MKTKVAAILLIAALPAALLAAQAASATEFHVSPKGNDADAGRCADARAMHVGPATCARSVAAAAQQRSSR